MPAISRGLFVVVSVLALSSCQEDAPRSQDSLTGVIDPLEAPRAACENSGGRWGERDGGILFTCFRETRDANQSCRANTDCQDVCLARSRTCAPVTPFLGCHEVLTNGGQTATQCIN